MRAFGGVRLERRPGRLNPAQRRSASLIALAAVVVFAGYALLLGRGAAWLDGSTLRGLTATQRVSEIDTMRGSLIQVSAGVLAAGALLYTALGFHLAREGHVTDRYTKAIEQLGSDALGVRIGSIYALERIMIDSARDHPTIVEVLAAFVRERTIPRPALDSDGQPEQEGLPTDVQAALTVLGRRPAGRTERGAVNLSGAHLIGADLNGANLEGANLEGAHLAGAHLAGAHLNRANLSEAHLNRATLIGAHLNDASLFGADLNRASLFGANLDGAYLASAKLNGAHLNGAQLNGADLAGVTLSDKQQSVIRS